MTFEKKTITGEVAQIISPRQQSKFSFTGKFKHVVHGNYVVVIWLNFPTYRDRLLCRLPWRDSLEAITVITESVTYAEGDVVTINATQTEIEDANGYVWADKDVQTTIDFWRKSREGQ